MVQPKVALSVLLGLTQKFTSDESLEEILQAHLPPDGPRMKIPTSRGLMLLVRNILLSREPIYGLGEWAQRQTPDLIGIPAAKMKHLNDDRLGRCVDRLFEALGSALILELIRHVCHHFALSLNELHNDSTTVTFHGTYEDALVPGLRQGLPTLAIPGHADDASRQDALERLTAGHERGVRPTVAQRVAESLAVDVMFVV